MILKAESLGSLDSPGAQPSESETYLGISFIFCPQGHLHTECRKGTDVVMDTRIDLKFLPSESILVDVICF